MDGSRKRKSRDEGEENYLFLTTFGRKVKEGVERMIKEREEREENRRKEMAEAVGGSFEKHTEGKGIGMKLLEKMGYKGGGLGKFEQGIVVPIEAKLKPRNMGVGYEKKDEALCNVRVVGAQGNQNVNPDQLLKRCREQELKVVVTAAELRERKPEVVVPQKVFDMRGPHLKIRTNLERLNDEHGDIPLPELLQHNAKLLLDLAESDIRKLQTDLRNEREAISTLLDERNKLEFEAAEQQKQLLIIEDIVGTLDRIVDGCSLRWSTLDSSAMSFSDLQKKHTGEYIYFNLPSIAYSYALHLFIQFFQDWDPLANPSYGLDLISSWRDILQSRQVGVFSIEDLLSPYMQLIVEVVAPAVRRSANAWTVRCPEPMIQFIDMWGKLLPPLIIQSILDMAIFSKLASAVDCWDRCTDTVPIHYWIHPWLPLLGDKLATLYPSVRQKLGKVLHAWHPSDGSAYTILSPWKTVFDAASWESLMVSFILPKLHEVMTGFVINPTDQKFCQFDWVMLWASVIPVHHMVTLLEVSFFCKWQKVLYYWLCANPNFEEIAEWFKGWKERLPSDLLANDRVRYQLNISLDMMNQAIEGLTVIQPGLGENISYLQMQEQSQFEAQQKAAAEAQKYFGGGVNGSGSEVPELSLKEIVEAYAQQHELSFKPKPRRMHDGLQIYGFGSISIAIDTPNQKVYAQTGDMWSLVSLEQLLDMQRGFVSKRQ